MVCLGLEPRVVGTDESTEQWRLPLPNIFLALVKLEQDNGEEINFATKKKVQRDIHNGCR